MYMQIAIMKVNQAVVSTSEQLPLCQTGCMIDCTMTVMYNRLASEMEYPELWQHYH